MKVYLNGEAYTAISEEDTLETLLKKLGLERRYHAIEVNHEIISQEKDISLKFKEGDIIEIVQFMGGGSQ